MFIYSIRNLKLKRSNPPFFAESEEDAISRIISTFISDNDNYLFALRDDLSLTCLGTIDFDNGVITDSYESPIHVAFLKDIYDSIPAERFKKTITPEQAESLLQYIAKLESDISAISDKVNSHRHHRKEILK